MPVVGAGRPGVREVPAQRGVSAGARRARRGLALRPGEGGGVPAVGRCVLGAGGSPLRHTPDIQLRLWLRGELSAG